MGPFSSEYSSRAISERGRKKLILPPYSSGKCHAILSCVGGIAATVVAEAGPWLWNQWEVGYL